jgi:hypothetical protein
MTTYNRIVISSGHALKVRGAAGVLDEVDEARILVEQVSRDLRSAGIDTVVFHDDVSTTQNENLNRIVDFHNSQARDLDISCHFNAYVETDKPMGTEVLYLTQADLATRMSAAIASAGGFLNRGPKQRTDLFFLNNTAQPSILIETCFGDSEADAKLYRMYFDLIAETIADVIGGTGQVAETSQPPSPVALRSPVRCRHLGVLRTRVFRKMRSWRSLMKSTMRHRFLPYQAQGTTGLARRSILSSIIRVADYNTTPKETPLESGAVGVKPGSRRHARPTGDPTPTPRRPTSRPA